MKWKGKYKQIKTLTMTNKPNNQSAQEVDKTLCPTCGAPLFEHQSKAGEYSLEDMRKAFEAGHKRGFSGYPSTENHRAEKFEEFIQSLTPTQSKAVGYSFKTVERAYYLGKSNKTFAQFRNYIQSLTPTPIQTKGREVEFAEWMNEVAVRLSNGHWQYGKDINNNRFSTQNLLEIFLTNNPSNKGA